MNAPFNVIAELVKALHAAGHAPTRVGQRVRLKNDHDVLGTDEGPARRPGERLIRWDADPDDGPWTISATQIEAVTP